jgi:polyhydroxybutyrate depolymerase
MRRPPAVLLALGLLLAAVAPLAVAGPVAAEAAAGASGCGTGRLAGTKQHTVRAAGLTRTYHLTVPPGYTGDTRVPLVLDLHGAGSNAAQEMALSRARQYAAPRGWVVATLDAGRVFWYLQARNGEDVDFVQRVVQDVARRLCIAPGRRFVMGMSNGAAMSAAVTCALPGTFAAAASVAGMNIAGTCLERPTPLLVVHGTADPIVPYQGGDLGGRLGGLLSVPSVASRLHEWSFRNHCASGPTSTVVVPTITLVEYQGCDAPTRLLRVSRGGHTWPGGPVLPVNRYGRTSDAIDATDEIFAFFADTFT